MRELWNRLRKRITLMIVPDSHHAAIKIRLPGIVLVILPVLLVLVCALAYLSHFQYERKLTAQQQLNAKLSSVAKQYADAVQEKDKQIGRLESDVQHLSDKAKEVQSKVDQLKQLESDIQSLTDFAPEPKRDRPVEIASAAPAGMGGPEIDVGGTDNLPMDGYGSPAEDESGVMTGDGADLSGMARLDYAPWSDPGYEEAPLGDQAAIRQTGQHFERLYGDLDKLLVQYSDLRQHALDYQWRLNVTPSIWPTVSKRITSPYGWRKDPFTSRSAYHSGIDIGGSLNDPVFATADGVVVYAGYDRLRGNNVLIKHDSGVMTRYLHMTKLLVKKNDHVKKGQTIGRLGSTGRSTGPHVHYEVIRSGVTIDPIPFTKPPKR